MSVPPTIVRGEGRLELKGELRIADATRIWKALGEQSAHTRGAALDIDLSQASVVDGAIMAFLVELRSRLAGRGITSRIVGASTRLAPIVHLYGGNDLPVPPAPPKHEGALTRLGRAVEAAGETFRRLILFLGSLSAALGRAVRAPSSLNLRSLPSLAERAGADGVPIVLVMNFLVGFVMAYQSSRQLELYGANVYVADVVGVSITRELAPLVTGVIMAGRSGAAYAAELGTMRVSEEIDALWSMGFAPAPYLILPRIAALALVAPVLTLLGDVVGMAGGLVVGTSSLHVSARGYLVELRTAIVASDVWTGLVKSVAFGAAIAFIGCEQGFSTRGAAAGVGRSTTTTVVTCLFTIVIVDTMFTMLFRTFGR